MVEKLGLKGSNFMCLKLCLLLWFDCLFVLSYFNRWVWVLSLVESIQTTPWTLRIIRPPLTPKWSHMSFSPVPPSKAVLGHPLVLLILVWATLPTSSESLSLALPKIKVRFYFCHMLNENGCIIVLSFMVTKVTFYSPSAYERTHLCLIC